MVRPLGYRASCMPDRRTALGQDRSGEFAAAWSHLDGAWAARQRLQETWNNSCQYPLVESVVRVDASGSGSVELRAMWPGENLKVLNDAARSFVRELRSCLDEAAMATAHCVSGYITTPGSVQVCFPIVTTEADFVKAVQDGCLTGVRPDHIRLVRTFQPIGEATSGNQPGDFIGRGTSLLLHLNDLPSDENAVTLWVHSIDPKVESDFGEIEWVQAEPDGPVEGGRTVATFKIRYDHPPAASDKDSVWADPNARFDLIFNAEPWPLNPDDNVRTRTAALLSVVAEAIRAFERSVGLRASLASDARRAPDEIAANAPGTEPTWAPIWTDDPSIKARLSAALRASDIGLATITLDGVVVVAIQTARGVFGRPVHRASSLDPRYPSGPAAEASTLTAAALWGLPDFVFPPVHERKGSGVRELGDGLVVVGSKGIVIQVKSRQATSGNDQRERNWLKKQSNKASGQASGTIRALRSGPPRKLVNGRGRSITLSGSIIDWVGVVILDHPSVPDDIESETTSSREKAVLLLRRDWEFLFDQLRSVSAVVDYLHRTKDASRHLGGEPANYFELALADDAAMSQEVPKWAAGFGGQHISHPVLPTEPVGSDESATHSLYRMMLDDIAESPFDSDETQRLQVLTWLDRLSVTYRSELAELLLTALRENAAPTPGATRWKLRRILQDDGALQLCFGVCSQLSDIHIEAFRQWAMLRHHDIQIMATPQTVEKLATVAVLLTPRLDTATAWDTTVLAIQGELDLTAEELSSMRGLWDRESTPTS